MGTFNNRVVVALRKLADKIDPAGAVLVQDDTYFDDTTENIERIADHYRGGGGGSGMNVLIIDAKTCPKPSASGLSYEDADGVWADINSSPTNVQQGPWGIGAILDLPDFSDRIAVDYIDYEGIDNERYYAIIEESVQATGYVETEDPSGGALALFNDVTAYRVTCINSSGTKIVAYIFPSTAQFIRVQTK